SPRPAVWRRSARGPCALAIEQRACPVGSWWSDLITVALHDISLLGQLVARLAPLVLLGLALLALVFAPARLLARRKRDYVRLRVVPYRGDESTLDQLVSMFEALHKRLQRRWWRRLLSGQPSI